MRWRAIQPAVFGLAVLSFLLPFANVSCATDPDIAQSGSPVLGATFVSRSRSRAAAGIVAGSAGLLSLIVLGLVPVIGTYGLLQISWRHGYWVCLVLFAAATAFSYLEHRDARPPPYLRE